MKTCPHCTEAFTEKTHSKFCSVACRFMSKVVVTDDCWLWAASLDSHGYGQFHHDRRTLRAHRFAWTLAKGEEPPADLDVDHLCRNRTCVNADHMEAVTRRTNTLRGASPTTLCYQMNRCQRGHEYTAENTVRKADGSNDRACRTCAKARRAERDAIHGLAASA